MFAMLLARPITAFLHTSARLARLKGYSSLSAALPYEADLEVAKGERLGFPDSRVFKVGICRMHTRNVCLYGVYNGSLAALPSDFISFLRRNNSPHRHAFLHRHCGACLDCGSASAGQKPSRSKGRPNRDHRGNLHRSWREPCHGACFFELLS
jgi:hypothetical protein